MCQRAARGGRSAAMALAARSAVATALDREHRLVDLLRRADAGGDRVFERELARASSTSVGPAGAPPWRTQRRLAAAPRIGRSSMVALRPRTTLSPARTVTVRSRPGPVRRQMTDSAGAITPINRGGAAAASIPASTRGTAPASTARSRRGTAVLVTAPGREQRHHGQGPGHARGPHGGPAAERLTATARVMAAAPPARRGCRSTIRPSAITMIRSAWTIVDSRCAITMRVARRVRRLPDRARWWRPRAGGFVEQQHRRIMDQGAPARALALAA